MPLSVLSNWEKQIEDHCTPGSLTSCVYYGAKRSLTPQELKRFDVVITTYQTVAGEHVDGAKDRSGEPSKKKKKKIIGSLFEVQWKVRVKLCISEVLRLNEPCGYLLEDYFRRRT